MHAPSIVMVLSHLQKRVAHDICRVETQLVSSERYFPAVCLLKTQMDFAREIPCDSWASHVSFSLYREEDVWFDNQLSEVCGEENRILAQGMT